MSFFQVVLAAAISTELSFLITIVGFLGLAVVAMTLLTLERGRLTVMRCAAQVQGVGQPLGFPPSPLGAVKKDPTTATGFLPRSYMVRMAVACIAVIALSAFFFLMIPRLAARKVFMRLRPFETDNVTGFSDEIELGGLAGIRKDRTVVMRGWVGQSDIGRSPLLGALYLRGVALDYFDGTKWSASRWARRHVRTLGRPYSTNDFELPAACDSSHQVRITIEQDMRKTKWLFGPPFIAELQFPRPPQVFYNSELHAFRAEMAPNERLWYRLRSSLEPPYAYIHSKVASANQTVSSTPNAQDDTSVEERRMADKVREHYLLLPRHLPRKDRIEALAADLTRGARTPLEQIRRLNRFFHGHFRYSLAAGDSRPTYYLADFLLQRREGHCETFATAMVVLCRMLGIPSRVVSGFYTTEFNRYFFYVRQSHAHTWVEVWLDGFGWTKYDPTPPAALTSERSKFAFLSIVSDYWDLWTVRWRRYIVDYNLSDQLRYLAQMHNAMVLAPLAHPSRRLFPSWYAFQRWMSQVHQRNRQNGYTFHKVSLTGLVLAWVVYRRQQRRNGYRKKRGRKRRKTACPVTFYREILAALARRGWRRQPGQTPAEFARVVADAQPNLAEFVSLTVVYYRVRFSPGTLQPGEHERGVALLEQIRRSRSLRRWARFAPRTAA
ncbi:MAG: hypothetical protein AMJ84_10195 [Acidithiobacillales bacterium SM23_46]|nr:MAG: hypothetical protein AMJ84_10195 [Acidithiobacillales bacterium SM23_46]